MPESLSVQSKVWIPGLDLVRCTAIFLVLIGHAKMLLPNASQEPFKQFFPMPAAWGVELFFSLSGFLIGRHWIAMNLNSNQPALAEVKYFVQNRWLRTMPTYWMVLALLLLIGAISLGEGAPLPALMSNLMLTNWMTGTPYALPVSWTLAIEEYSYLLIGSSVLITLPLLRLIEPQQRRYWLPVFPALLIFIGVLIRITTVQAGHWEDLIHSPWYRLDALAYGLLLACLVEPRPITAISAKCWRRPLAPALLVGSLLFLQHWRICLLVDLKSNPFGSGMLFSILLLPALGIVTSGWVMLTSAWRSSGFRLLDQAIKHLAQISYSVYLVHIPLRSFMVRHWTAATTLEGFLFVSSFLLISILIGDLTYRLLEQPFLSLKKRLDRAHRLKAKPLQPPVASVTAVVGGKR